MAKPAKKTVMRSESSSGASPKVSKELAIVCLVLNIVILPGLGSLIGGKKTAGIWQIVLTVVGIPLSIVLIGLPIILAAWVWGIVTGVQLIQESR